MQSQCLRRILLSQSFAHEYSCLVEKRQPTVGDKIPCRTKCRNTAKVFNLIEVTEHVGRAVAYHLFSIQCGITQGNCWVVVLFSCSEMRPLHHSVRGAMRGALEARTLIALSKRRVAEEWFRDRRIKVFFSFLVFNFGFRFQVNF